MHQKDALAASARRARGFRVRACTPDVEDEWTLCALDEDFSRLTTNALRRLLVTDQVKPDNPETF
jgi:hypothetical protein